MNSLFLVICISLLILGLVILVGGPIAYFVWIGKTWRRGPKWLFWSQIVTAMIAAVVIGGVALDFFRNSQFSESTRYCLAPPSMKRLNGSEFALGKPGYHYDTGPSFNGDGYSISVYDLTPEMARYFSAPPPEFFASYPKKLDPRYELQTWNRGPVRDDEKWFINFALREKAPKEQARLDKAYEAIRRSLAKSTTHYAYSYLMNGELVSDIDFFLIDPEEQRLYIIKYHT